MSSRIDSLSDPNDGQEEPNGQEEEKPKQQRGPEDEISLSDYESAQSRVEGADADGRAPRKGCCGYVNRCSEKWPRVCNLLFGVVLPLWGLILLSVFFGRILSDFEADEEIVSNDNTLGGIHLLSLTSELFANVTSRAPLVCVGLYFRNQTSYEEVYPLTSSRAEYTASDLQADIDFAIDIHTQVDLFIGDIDGDTVRRVQNDPGFVEFFFDCIQEAREIHQRLFRETSIVAGRAAGNGISFNWNRCAPEDNQTYPNLPDFGADVSFNNEFRHEEQREHYWSVWLQDWSRLYDKYLEEGMLDPGINETEVRVRLKADLRATEEATGKEACELNVESAAWFWFTVMTTIGYGNQSPVTTGGRTLVYTLGFLSIVVFAGVLATSSSIIASIIDDFLKRINFGFLSWPWLACLIWGSFWYLWMFGIATYYQQWRKDRLEDDEFSLRDGYWFAYISTTTVGLGDFYLDPEVLVGLDLVRFPLLFLFGFVLLGLFLGKLSDLLVGHYERNSTPLSVQLERTSLCGLCFAHKETTKSAKTFEKKVGGSHSVAEPSPLEIVGSEAR